MERKLNAKNLKKRVDEVIEAAGLPDTPEMHQMVEDLFLGRTTRYSAEELDKIDIVLAKRIMDKTATELQTQGVEVEICMDVPKKEENIMYC